MMLLLLVMVECVEKLLFEMLPLESSVLVLRIIEK